MKLYYIVRLDGIMSQTHLLGILRSVGVGC